MYIYLFLFPVFSGFSMSFTCYAVQLSLFLLNPNTTLSVFSNHFYPNKPLLNIRYQQHIRCVSGGCWDLLLARETGSDSGPQGGGFEPSAGQKVVRPEIPVK